MPKRFRIAFSFAGEKREYVAKVARLLANRFGEPVILYDKFHEAEFALYDLGIRLPKLYGEQSELIVPVLCPNYDKKLWTGWEWVHIYGLLTKEDGRRVMPSRFEQAHVEGLSRAAGFVELDDKSPEEFANLILERLALNEGHAKDHYTRPAIAAPILLTSIPHNLPSLQPFFGREAELAKIAEALDPESRTWGALIDGPGGMGKTSLAIRAAHAVPADAFEKIVFVSLKSRELDDDGVRDLSGFLISGLAELLNELARELGHPDIPKKPEDQRPRLLLDALRGHRFLLLLDNLESLIKRERDTIFTFVKKLPPGCKAILTSRGRIGSGAEELILGKLDEAAALKTLAKLAEGNSALARTSDVERLELYSATAGKPLLLRWTAGQIGRGRCVTLADSLAFLRSCPPDNDPLEFIFGDLVEDFSSAETRALCALTYFTLPAKLEHIAAVANHDGTADVATALKLLINRSLVVPSEEMQTFTLVPLVADYLRKAKPEVLRETGSQLENSAYAIAVENGYQHYDQIPVLDAAWPTVAAALPLFLDGDNGRLQSVADALRDFLDFTGRWDEWLAFSRDAEKRAVMAAELVSAGWRATDIAYLHVLKEQPDEVLAWARRAEDHWREAKAGAIEQAVAIRTRGVGLRLAKKYDAAIAAFGQALELFRSLSFQSQNVAMVFNDRATAENCNGNPLAAERDYREALRVALAINFREGVAVYRGNLAELALNREDWLEAEKLAREALTVAEEIWRQQLIARNSLRIATSLLRQGRPADALPHAQRAATMYKKLGLPDLTQARQILTECNGLP